MNLMKRSSILSGCILCGLLGSGRPVAGDAQPALSAPMTADNYVLPAYVRSRPTLPAHWGDRRPRLISRREAVETALRSNLDLSFEREQVRIADIGRTQALGSFEPRLSISVNRTGSQSPPQTAQEGQAGQVYQTTTDNWNLSISELLPTATLLTLSFNNSRFESSQANAVLPVRYFPNIRFSLSQPLLQGFSIDGRVQTSQVLSARFNSEKERESARLLAMQTIQATESAYWDLLESWKTYEVARGAYERSEKQLDFTRRQITAGIVPPSELLSAEGRLAQVQVQMVSAESAIGDAADALRRLLNLPPDDWEQPLLPLDPPSFTRGGVPFDAAYERAVAARPELKSAQIDTRQSVLDLIVARNRRLPQLNFSTSLSTLGQDADYGAALAQMADRSGWTWSAGLDLNWAPIGVATRAGIRSQEAVVRQTRISREKVLVRIRTEVRAALRNIDNAERQVYAAAQSRDLAERNLDLEQRRFLNGIQGVTNLTLALRQGDLATAQLTEVQALLRHERAHTLLLLAMGELLETWNLKFEVRRAG